MSDVVPITLKVGGRQLRAGASRSGRYWTISAAAFPEIRLTGTDLGKLKIDLARRLVPECERVEKLRGVRRR